MRLTMYMVIDILLAGGNVSKKNWEVRSSERFQVWSPSHNCVSFDAVEDAACYFLDQIDPVSSPINGLTVHRGLGVDPDETIKWMNSSTESKPALPAHSEPGAVKSSSLTELMQPPPGYIIRSQWSEKDQGQTMT